MSYLEQLFNLEGRHAVVTGASRGLGNAMATALAEAGAHVHLVGSVAETIQAAAQAARDEKGTVRDKKDPFFSLDPGNDW